MAKDTSEERNLPASKKKLREARKKGQVAKSRDLVGGAALATGLGVVLLAGGAITTTMGRLIVAAGALGHEDLRTGLAALAPPLKAAAAAALAPLLLIPLAAVLTSMIMLQGIPFAVDPVTPKMEKINPAEGFKRLFQLRNWVELAKSLVKTVIIAAVLIAVLAGGLNALVLAPSSGLVAEIAVLHALAAPMLGAAALVFLLAGGIDYFLQRWLFLRDQKMSVSEQKRERKDMEGDPHFRAHRKRIMREALRLAGGLGLKRATLLIHDGDGLTVGLRFIMGEMPAPVMVCRARGSRGQAMLTEGAAAGLPTVEDAGLARDLLRVPLGFGIPEKLFRPVALALRRAGAG